MNSHGYTVIEATIVLVIIVILGFGGYLIYKHEHKTASTNSSQTIDKQSNTSSTATNAAYAVLSPATVPSKTAECNQAITYASNGVPGPVQCSDGDLNVTDWQALAALEPNVLTLGYSATASEIQSALCSDVQANISNPIEETVYQIASLYYGWDFGTSPTSVISNGTCQNVDD